MAYTGNCVFGVGTSPTKIYALPRSGVILAWSRDGPGQQGRSKQENTMAKKAAKGKKGKSGGGSKGRV